MKLFKVLEQILGHSTNARREWFYILDICHSINQNREHQLWLWCVHDQVVGDDDALNSLILNPFELQCGKHLTSQQQMDWGT